MAANGKSGIASAPQNVCNSITGLIGDWIRQGTDGFVATQKILLDLAAQQNALAITLVRERLGFATMQTKPLTEFTSVGIKNLNNMVEAGRVVLDAMARQNAIVADAVLPRVAGTPAERVAQVLRQETDNLIATQKEFLDLVESQVEGAMNDLGERKRFDAGRISDLARDGVCTFVRSQRKFLEIVEGQLAGKQSQSSGQGEERKPAIDFIEVANKSINSLIDVQRQLLDLAAEQIQANVKFGREMFSVETSPTTTLADLAKKSVDSFVAAQKALAELASKPRKPAESESECRAADPLAAHG